jgi:hypothetical protein
MSERTSIDGPWLDMTPGMSDDAADTVFGSGELLTDEPPVSEDDETVGAARRDADAERSR